MVKDETRGFLFNGFVSFVLPEEMEKKELYGKEGFFLRALLQEGTYDLAPVISRANVNVLRCRQQETLAECRVYEGSEIVEEETSRSVSCDSELSAFGQTEVYLWRDGSYYPTGHFEKTLDEEKGLVWIRVFEAGEMGRILVIHRETRKGLLHFPGVGNGFPNQQIDLEDVHLLEEPFSLLIEDEMRPGGYQLWESVPDFAASKPEDRHFVLRSDTGRLYFGDGVAGRVPEGKIRTAQVVRSMGTGGNIREGRIDRFQVPDFASIFVTNISEGVGGRNEESLEDCFLRAHQKIARPKVLVSVKDYEEKVMNTPGLLIADCKVLFYDEVSVFFRHADKNAVHIVVEPLADDPDSVEGSYRENIETALDPYRMIGASIAIYFVEYVEVDIFAELLIAIHFRDIKEQIEKNLRVYFSEELSSFGTQILYSNLYSYLERLPDVLGVRALSLHASGVQTVRNRQGDLLIPPHAKVKLGKMDILLEMDERAFSYGE